MRSCEARGVSYILFGQVDICQRIAKLQTAYLLLVLRVWCLPVYDYRFLLILHFLKMKKDEPQQPHVGTSVTLVSQAMSFVQSPTSSHLRLSGTALEGLHATPTTAAIL